MKGVELTTAMGTSYIQESVDDIVKQVTEVGETGHLFYTVVSISDPEKGGLKASCIAGLYRMVREVEFKPQAEVEELEKKLK